MKDEMNDIIQKNMVSMISDIDINHVNYDIRMSMIDSMVKLIVDTIGDKSPSKEVVKYLDPTIEFDIMNIETDIKTSENKPENVILKEVLCLMKQLDPAQRTVVMHYFKTMFVYDASLLKDRNSFTRQYKPIVRGLKKFKGGSPFVCRKCRRLFDLEKEVDIMFDPDRPIRFPDCDESLIYSFMFSFTPINQWVCVECFDPHEGEDDDDE